MLGHELVDEVKIVNNEDGEKGRDGKYYYT
jgi:hypothetical protein